MRRDEWARLAAPFPSHALDWCVAQLDREGSTARLEPVVSEAAVVERLDAVLGVEGWSVRLLPLGADAVVCELALLGVHKSAVAGSFAGTLAMERVGAWALGRAAGLCGMHPSTRRGAWVDFDLEAGEPVFLPESGPESGLESGPEITPGAEAALDAGAGTADAPNALARDDLPAETAAAVAAAGDAGESVSEEGAAELDGSRNGGSGNDGSGNDGAGNGGSWNDGPVDGGQADREADGSAGADAGAGAARSEGQQAIERLVDRLRAEGLGRQAAALVVEYGGYGRSAEAARELYRRLRELLLQKGAPS